MDGSEARPLPELVVTLVSELGDLVRKEADLLRAEINQKIRQVEGAAVLMALAVALLLGGFLVLLEAVVLAVSLWLGLLWSSIVVGVVIVIVGVLLIRAGISKLRPQSLAPERSVRQLNKDAHFAKDQI